MDLNDEHMRAIAPEINMNYDKMSSEGNRGQRLAYFDPNFAYKNNKHDVENLMLLGWLLCKHWDDTTQGRELWHILNPTLAETIPKQHVMAVVRKLIYIAYDVNFTLME